MRQTLKHQDRDNSMPTPEQIRAAHPELFGPVGSHADDPNAPVAPQSVELPQGVPGEAPAPSWLSRIKDIATSGPAMKTAGMAVGEIVAGALGAPESGGMSALMIPPALAALGSVIGGGASRNLHGEVSTPQNAAGDALEGVGGHYLGPVLSKVGKGAAYVRDLIPRSARIPGMIAGQVLHPSLNGLAGEAAAEVGPEALQSAGGAVTKGRDWLQQLGRGAENTERPVIDTATPPKGPWKRQPFQEPKLYRMGGEPSSFGNEPNIMSETRNAAHMAPPPPKPPSSFEALMSSHMPEPELVPEAAPVPQMDVDASGVTESLAGMDDALGKVPQGKGARVLNRNLTRDTEEQASAFRGAANHGVSGFGTGAGEALSPASRVSSLAELEALMGRMKR